MNDVGCFGVNQNVVIEANLVLYIFQGTASACPVLPMPADAHGLFLLEMG